MMKLWLNPFVFAATGKIADSLTTTYGCLKYGIEVELVSHTRAYLETFGIIKGIIFHNVYALVIVLGITAVLYGFDLLLETNADRINLHKSWLYGIGGLTYFAAINNALGIFTGNSIVGIIIERF
jgi:hypothetical protein